MPRQRFAAEFTRSASSLSAAAQLDFRRRPGLLQASGFSFGCRDDYFFMASRQPLEIRLFIIARS